ncbi:MAG: OmpA family protein, partial [Mariprofundus sp.]
MMIIRYAVVLAAMMLLGAMTAEAALDEVQLRMLKAYPQVLRWDNIEAAPEWVSGKQPARVKGRSLHSVQLQAGESTTVRLAGGEWLRIHRISGALAAADLEVDFSSGSGLYQRLVPARSSDGHDLLSRMRVFAPSLVRISRPLHADGAIDMALFVSRHQQRAALAPYRKLIPLPGESVQMRRGDEASAQRYWSLLAAKPVQLQLQGPARYALENRYRYAAGESALIQSYRVHVRLDHQPLRSMAFETSAESVEPVYVDGSTRVTGRRAVDYLEIPAGLHHVSLDSTAPLYARLLLQEQSDYLFPVLNGPKRTPQQLRQDEHPFALTGSGQTPAGNDARALQLRLTSWLISDAELAGLDGTQQQSLREREVAAERLVRDNAHREGGLLGAMLMQQTLLPDYPAVQTVASEMLGHHSFYRDLLPEQKRTQSAQFFARFIPRRLHAAGEQGRGMVAAGQHLQQLLDRIPGAYFNEVPRYDGATPLQVQSDGAKMRITLPADILFDTDKSILKPRFRKQLEAAAALVRNRHAQRIVVTGHTDSRASEPYNQALSERRAKAVANYLARRGINLATIYTDGKGELQPRADNNTVSGRALNRRVEILLEGSAKGVRSARALPGYHRYLLPARIEPSLLRVIVDRPARASDFMLQFDDDKAIAMHLLPARELPSENYAPAQGDAALEMLAHQFGAAHAFTSSGPYAARRMPGTLIDAGLLEIPLPAGVGEVRVWRIDPAAEPVHIALQYRAA